jgi:Rrf2 family nitric oxide-sensitive transcriptional repressor
MRLTKFSDYALRALLYAASVNGGRLVTIEETATLYGISRGHLKKVVLQLVREGFLAGTRGRAGGFGLAKPPEQITVGAVLRVTEPEFGLFECFMPENQCCLTLSCKLPKSGAAAVEAFLAVFDKVTLADIRLDESEFPCKKHDLIAALSF